MTVGQVLELDNVALGGGSTGYNLADLETLTADLNGSFFNGSPDAVAQDHLLQPDMIGGGGNPIVTPEPSSLLLWVGLLAVGALHYWWRR